MCVCVCVCVCVCIRNLLRDSETRALLDETEEWLYAEGGAAVGARGTEAMRERAAKVQAECPFFTCFTSTKVQILAMLRVAWGWERKGLYPGALFTCFSSTQV